MADSSGRFAYEGLERVMHEKARLGILTSLATHPGGLFFNDLKAMVDLTDGNLSRHLAALKERSLVELLRGTYRNRPQTLVRMTDEGRERFREYIDELSRVVDDAQPAAREQRRRPAPFPEGFSPA